MIILMNMLINMLITVNKCVNKYVNEYVNDYVNMLMIMWMIMYFGHNSTYIGRQPAIFCMRGFLYISYRPVMPPGPGEP